MQANVQADERMVQCSMRLFLRVNRLTVRGRAIEEEEEEGSPLLLSSMVVDGGTDAADRLAFASVSPLSWPVSTAPAALETAVKT